MLDNCTQLIKFDNPFQDDMIATEIRKSIQIVNHYTEEKNQNWLWFRWKIWEEICRQMPIKTKQPLWPFGKLVYYNKRFVLGTLDVWVAHYWYALNNGILYLENSYLEPFEYKNNKKKKIQIVEKNKVDNVDKIVSKEHINNLKQKANDFRNENFVHQKEFTEAKYNYLLEEENKYNVRQKSNGHQVKSKKYKIKNVIE